MSDPRKNTPAKKQVPKEIGTVSSLKHYGIKGQYLDKQGDFIAKNYSGLDDKKKQEVKAYFNENPSTAKKVIGSAIRKLQLNIIKEAFVGTVKFIGSWLKSLSYNKSKHHIENAGVASQEKIRQIESDLLPNSSTKNIARRIATNNHDARGVLSPAATMSNKHKPVAAVRVVEKEASAPEITATTTSNRPKFR
jgi:hypothetical protein